MQTFDYNKYNAINKYDLSNMNCNNANYIVAPEIESSRNYLCKIYNQKYLLKCKKKGSKEKADQPWYSQLQILREAFLLKELDHPAVIKFFGLNLFNNQVHFQSQDDNESKGEEEEEEEEEGMKYNPTLFLEYTSMRSIQQQLTSSGQLNKKMRAPVKRQICIIGITAAIRFLHENNIVHRNLCPEAIWLDDNLYPKIFDFSHSREFDQEDDDEQQNEKLKNVTYNGDTKCAYQTPEEFDGKIQYEYLRSLDIFALGRLLYLMLTGYEAFKYDKGKPICLSVFQIKDLTVKGVFPYIPDKVSEKWKYILECCWSHNPNERPSADDIINIIKEKDFYIDGIKEDEFSEIEKYKNLIQEYDNKKNKNQFRVPLKMSKAGKFQVKLNDYKFEDLDNLLRSNTVDANGNKFLELINNLIETQYEEFIKKNYLPKIMKYLDKFLENKYAAKEFIKKAFGKPIDSRNNKSSIQMTYIVKGIETVNISPKITKIGSHAFSGSENLKRVFIPDSVQVIEDEAFSVCPQLQYVYLPKSIKDKNLGKGVFRNCPNLKYIRIPKYLTAIKKSTFEGDKKLKRICLNNKLLNIDEKAFCGCSSLKSIKIPESVTSIGRNAFKSCKILKEEGNFEFPGASKNKIILIKCGFPYSK